MIVEPFAHGDLEHDLNPVGRLFFGASALVCTPGSLNDAGAALGTQVGAERLGRLLEEAGFTHVRVVVETPFNVVIEAKP